MWGPADLWDEEEAVGMLRGGPFCVLRLDFLLLLSSAHVDGIGAALFFAIDEAPLSEEFP